MNGITITDAAARIRDGRLRPRELVEGCLDRISRYDDRVRAWVMVDEAGALEAADRLGEEAARGEIRGPLHGIPIGIKDIIDVAGWPTRAGSPLREDHVADEDAPVVAALKRAGAILLGKTVTVEFACFDPSPTRNPWDRDLNHSPGGSSSGSAAAVAMGMCPGSIGTQTGGSLVRPAAYCGIATCKPTFGRVDTAGIVPVSFHLDHSRPMARSVDDLGVLLDVLPPSRDFQPARAKPAKLVDDFESRPSPRLGLPETFFLERANEAVRQVFDDAVEGLRRNGAEVTPVELPEDFTDILDVHTRVMAVEAAAYHRRQFLAHRSSYGPKITGLLDQGLATSGTDYAKALAKLWAFRRRIIGAVGDLDALVMPSTDTTAPATLATTGPKDFQAPWSCAGVPVISIPCGLGADGMPVGMQLVAPHHQEAQLFAVARWCERIIEFRHLPPLLVD